MPSLPQLDMPWLGGLHFSEGREERVDGGGEEQGLGGQEERKGNCDWTGKNN